jgi:hypothetical protein
MQRKELGGICSTHEEIIERLRNPEDVGSKVAPEAMLKRHCVSWIRVAEDRANYRVGQTQLGSFDH